MNKQIHLVVVWDSESKEFHADMGSNDTCFPDGEVWNEATEQWEVAEYDFIENAIMALDGLVRSAGKVEIEGRK